VLQRDRQKEGQRALKKGEKTPSHPLIVSEPSFFIGSWSDTEARRKRFRILIFPPVPIGVPLWLNPLSPAKGPSQPIAPSRAQSCLKKENYEFSYPGPTHAQTTKLPNEPILNFHVLPVIKGDDAPTRKKRR
jgi:hypothetical protein